MNKKTLFTTGMIAILIIAGLAWFFVFKPTTEETETGTKSIFSYFFPTSEEEPTPITLTPPISRISPTSPNTATKQGTLTQLTFLPISGATFNNDSGRARYLEKITGHVYEVDPSGNNKKQITITTIPKTFKASWSTDPSQAVIKYFDDQNEIELVRTFLASFSTTTEGVFLPSNTSSVAISPNKNQIFYLLKNSETKGILSSFENTNKKEIFTSSFTEFTASWPQESTITLLTKPSASTEGYLYKLSPLSGLFSKIIGGIKGLTILCSPTNDKILYSESAKNTLSTKVYDISEKNSVSFGINTLPEKCLFSAIDEEKVFCATPRSLPTADYPDDWYQGLLLFSDRIWQINLESGTTQIISSEVSFDAINLFTNKEETYLFFQNKENLTLWSLRL